MRTISPRPTGGGPNPTLEGVDRHSAALKRSYQAEGPEGYWRQQLRDALQANKPDGHFGIAVICMHLGERDKALDWIEKGLRAHDPYTFY